MSGRVSVVRGDVPDTEVGQEQFDIILAGPVLDHFRDEVEWKRVFGRLYEALRPGGSVWISRFVDHSVKPIRDMMTARYGAYLEELRGRTNRDSEVRVFQGDIRTVSLAKDGYDVIVAGATLA